MSWSPRTAASLALLRAAERLHRAAAALAADRPIPDAPRPAQDDSRALAERVSRARHPSAYRRPVTETPLAPVRPLRPPGSVPMHGGQAVLPNAPRPQTQRHIPGPPPR